MELHGLLLGVIDREEKGSTDYIIADYILHNVYDLEKCSSGDLAKACNVSKSSISRFCRNIGLEDFFSLRVLIKTYQPSKRVKEKYAFENRSENDVADYLAESRVRLEEFQASFDYEQLSRIVKDIHDYENVVMMGLYQSACIANSLQKDLLSFNKIVNYVSDIFKQRKILETSTSDDLIIIFSATAAYFESVLPRKNIMNRKSQPKIYVITVSDSSEYDFVHKYIRLASGYNFASCMLLNFYATAVAIEYKTKYYVS